MKKIIFPCNHSIFSLAKQIIAFFFPKRLIPNWAIYIIQKYMATKVTNGLNFKHVQSQRWKYNTCNYYNRATAINTDFTQKPPTKYLKNMLLKENLSRKLLGSLAPVSSNVIRRTGKETKD